MAAKKTSPTEDANKSAVKAAGKAPGNPKTASGLDIPKQTLDTSHQGDIPVNPAAKLDQVEEAEKAKIADQKYRESQAGKEDPPYKGDRTNHAEYMGTLETHEERNKADEEATKSEAKSSK